MPESLESIYRVRVKKIGLTEDAAQLAALKSFQRLHDEIERAAGAEKNIWQKFIMSLTPRGEGIKGVYIYGAVGRGKSMLMDLFYNALPGGISKRRTHFHAFMIEVHDYIHTRRQEDDFQDGIDGVLPSLASRIAEQSRVLCFDEFQVTDVADAMILGRLFTALFEKGVVVVATSNWPPDDLYKGGLQRDRFLPFINLLKAKMDVVHLNGGQDYRAMFLQQEGSYFWPLNAGATARARDLFAKMTAGIQPHEENLMVKGREIPVIAAGGVAWFSFSQLCERPLGAEDYLAIARKYHTVFLENVPKINYDRRNEAKRLMILVDALYENRTRLIVTADAPAEGLYQGHDHGFEFQRTVSRLLEMQSKAYLGKG